jgi:hypothetical protein
MDANRYHEDASGETSESVGKGMAGGPAIGRLRAEMCFRLAPDIVFLNFAPLLRQ